MPRTGRFVRIFLTALALIAGGLPTTAFAQYFGQNKVQYDTFDFRVLETEHFDIHFYPSEAEAAADRASASLPNMVLRPATTVTCESPMPYSARPMPYHA